MIPRVLALLFVLIVSTASAQAPPQGITVPGTVERIIDGDTLDIIVTTRVRVRLLDCWAPEVTGPERPKGETSKAALARLIPIGSAVDVHVPTDQASSVASVLTFGRVLAHVWPAGGKLPVSELMVAGGWATEAKDRGEVE